MRTGGRVYWDAGLVETKPNWVCTITKVEEGRVARHIDKYGTLTFQRMSKQQVLSKIEEFSKALNSNSDDNIIFNFTLEQEG